MSISPELGSLHAVELPQGRLLYRERGVGEPVIFVHGVGVNADLWRDVVPLVARSYRCLAPDLPLGSHDVPMRADADLSAPGIAKLIDDFLAALQIDEATIVANDTGGGYAQILVTRHPERVARLVLFDCDAFENFPPRGIRTLGRLLGRLPAAIPLLASVLTPRPLQWLGFIVVTRSFWPPEIGRSYIDRHRPNEIWRDLAKVARGIDKRYTLQAAAKLGEFDRPTLVAWSPTDRFFPYRHAIRLSELIPQARLRHIHQSRGFVSEDQPAVAARHLLEFLDDFPLDRHESASP